MPSPSDPEPHLALEIIKANARLLYGRHQTYDIVISQPKYPGQSFGQPKYAGQKIHALLIAYNSETKGKLLRGAFSMGVHRTPPTVAYAIQVLHESVAADVQGCVERLVKEPGFEGGLMETATGEADVDDGIDGVTLRGD